jgi:arylsulfatase A-like enzyme
MTKPNIVFILCDDLGINDLHCYGRQDHNTPHLDRLASEGVRCTSAYCSQPICSASRAGLLTGLNPGRLHLTTFLPGRPNCAAQRVLHPEIMLHVPLTVKMLPRYFKEAGYVTGSIGKWHVGGQGFGPADHGFDHVYTGRQNTEPSATEGGKAEYELTRAALDFIENNRHRPFLAYLAHHTPHIPYKAKPHLVEKNKSAFEPVYAALIETLDDTVGLVMQKLDALGLADNTILVFTSDNGGLHVPEGGHTRVTHNTPYRAGKGYVYEGGLRVPLIARWPGRFPRGHVIHEPINNTGWLPTLLELAGASVPTDLDGISFAHGLMGGAVPAAPLFWHFPHYTNQGSRPSGAMREGTWLLVELYDEAVAELYDLSADVSEQHNIAAQHPARVAAMQAGLDAYRKENDVQYNQPNPNCDEAVFCSIYADTDASMFNPATAGNGEWQRMFAWRRRMDKAVEGLW